MMKKAFRSIPILGVPNLDAPSGPELRPGTKSPDSHPEGVARGKSRAQPGEDRDQPTDSPTRKGWNRIVASLFHPFSRVESFASPRDHGVM